MLFLLLHENNKSFTNRVYTIYVNKIEIEIENEEEEKTNKEVFVNEKECAVLYCIVQCTQRCTVCLIYIYIFILFA